MRRIRQWLWVPTVCALLCAPTPAQQRETDPIAAAQQLQREGQWDAAATEYRAALADDPDRPDLLANLGVVQVHAGDFSGAIASYEKALQLDPTLDAVRFNLGLAYYKTEHWRRAASDFAGYRAKHPTDSRSALLEADCDLRLNQYAAAIATAGPIADRDRNDLTAAYIVGTAYIRQGNVPAGEALIDRIMHHGDSAEVHMMLGDAYLQVHKMAQAAQEFARAVALNPRLPLAHLRLAEAELMSRDSDAAWTNLQAEYALNPNDFETNFYLGFVAKNRGDLVAATAYLKQAQAERPDAFQPSFQLATVEYQANQLGAARTILERLVKTFPDETDAHVILGQVYYRLKQPALGAAQRMIVQRLNAAHQVVEIKKREANADGPPVPQP